MKIWLDSEIVTAARLERAGKDALEIAKAVGKSPGSVRRFFARRGQTLPRANRPRWVYESELRQMASEGVYAAEIGRRLGVKLSEISYHARRLGVTLARAPAADGWPPERVDRLRALIASETASAGEIARQLGVTRNQVIGKCRRLGLRLPNARETPTDPRLVAPPVREPQEPRESRTHPRAPRQDRDALAQAVYALRDRQCRWPVGLGFCSLDRKQGSYCDHHAAASRRVSN